MPSRSFIGIFVEVVSFLTLFAMLGSMSSNFWERYLIQSELSKMKTSLHMLKATVYNIGTTYDNLHHDLKELSRKKEKISYNSDSKDSSIPSQFDHMSTIKSNKEETESLRSKTYKNQATNAFKEDRSPVTYDIRFAVNNTTAATLNPLKSTVNKSDKEANTTQNNIYENGAHLKKHATTQIHKCCTNNRCMKYANNNK